LKLPPSPPKLDLRLEKLPANATPSIAPNGPPSIKPTAPPKTVVHQLIIITLLSFKKPSYILYQTWIIASKRQKIFIGAK
jgi:hypothetical protein